MSPKSLFALLRDAAYAWIDDNVIRLAAALAFFAIFSLAPLLVIVISIASFVFGEDAARGHVATQLQGLAGTQAAEAIQAIVRHSADQETTGVLATLAGFAVLLFGASGVFGELKDALNLIWGVQVKPGRTWLRLIRDRFLSFTMVLGIGFLLLVSLVVSALLAALSKYMSGWIALPAPVWATLDFVISLIVISALFAMIFKILPNVRLAWRDVAIGAVSTALLFTIGKFAIGFYLGTSSVSSSWGAAGSVVIVLLWVFFSSAILFFGAEITKIFARRHGSGIVPDARAELIEDALCARYGRRPANEQAAKTTDYGSPNR
ncbi:MAG: YihY/virulence factor BrkB family protein [Verrucomicrobiota bacterium]|nr:YihY/virulence factor BrkB family protein [Verrucomicrobiota bacterium]